MLAHQGVGLLAVCLYLSLGVDTTSVFTPDEISKKYGCNVTSHTPEPGYSRRLRGHRCLVCCLARERGVIKKSRSQGRPLARLAIGGRTK